MKATKVIDFECIMECPNCQEAIYVDLDEILAGGCYCMDCEKDFEIGQDSALKHEDTDW